MNNNIPEPVLNDLPHHVLGQIKFVDYDRKFGFLTHESNEYFIHCQWLKEASFEVIGEQHNIVLNAANDRFHQDQKVLFFPTHSPRGLEAVDVVDALTVQILRLQAKKSYEVSLRLWQTLVSYRVTLIKDILIPKANNEKKAFDWVKTGETKVVIFEGNNANAMKSTLSSPQITGVTSQPNTRLKYEVKADDGWVECSNPLERS